MAESKKFKNRCQYWSDPEPPQCSYWDKENTLCTYGKDDEGNSDPEIKDVAERAPYCNLIGTAILCNKYKKESGAKDQKVCILPDPRRHVCNRSTGLKWVTVSGTSDSGSVLWDFDAINGYNDGACDGFGTDVTCSGYSPYHMGFGTLTPSDDPKYDTFKDSYGNFVDQYSTTKEFGYRLPTNFVVYNIRAVLSKCYWWKDAPGVFMVDAETGEVKLSSAWMCNSPNDTSKHSLFTLDNGPPCNGCKPECESYIGVCWQYCIDEKMEPGDPILAEQIHELRYYHREHKWTKEAIELLFLDHGTIFAWSGSRSNGTECDTDSSGEKIDEECVDAKFATLKGQLSVTLGKDGKVEEYEIPAVSTQMLSFDIFKVEHKEIVLTQGTEVTNQLKDFPTLIREIKQLPLSPIIQNKFTEFLNVNSGIKTNLVETPYLSKKTLVLVYGKVFYRKDTFAINLSDKELRSILPYELYIFDNIYDIETALSSENFEIFKTRLKATIEAIKKINPDKIYYNMLSLEDYTFTIEVPSLSLSETYNSTNENTVMVFQELDDNVFIYDKISFTKRVVGGTLIQTKFSVLGDGLDVKKYPPYFEKSFMGRMNENTSISFDFVPFSCESITTKAAYYYNDSAVRDPLEGNLMCGFKQYKVIIPIHIADFKQIGCSCYFRVTIEHPYINSIFKPFEADEITIGSCEMKITHHGADGKIPPNHLIIEPKNKGELVSLCESGVVVLRNLTYIEKRSFDEEPTCTSGSNFIIDGDFDGVDSFNILGTSASKSTEDSNPFEEIINFDFPLTPTVVMQDSTGRPICQSRTKPIGLVKQVTCPDIEIQYNWTAKYDTFYIRDVCASCTGEWWEEKQQSDVEISSRPKCGDHWDYCGGNRIGPMWWPYNTCDEYDSYNQITNLDNYSFEVLDLFKKKDADGSYINGSFNHRMLGPHKHYGRTGLYCPDRMCYCKSEIFNSHTTGDPYFTGYAKVRAGVHDNTIIAWCYCGSDPIIQFGNERRSVLRTYRTLDAAPFIRKDVDLSFGCEPRPRTDWRLMPSMMAFSIVDITMDEDEMWDYMCSSDGRFNVINPLGFFKAKSFDGIEINETVDNHNRFRFEEIIRCKIAMGLGYPKNSGEYVNSNGAEEINSWYEFLRYPVGGSEATIQWAWREVWKPLERNISYRGDDFKSFVDLYMENQFTGYTKGTFTKNAQGEFEGFFSFLDLSYPKYLYDYTNKEFRLIIEEGEHIISFVAPEKDEYTGEYKANCKLQLDDGPERCFDEYGRWVDDNGIPVGSDIDTSCNKNLYSKCIGNPITTTDSRGNVTTDKWTEEVALFAPGYTDVSIEAAVDDNRKVTKFDAYGGTINTYFNRGLKVEFKELTCLPVEVIPITQTEIVQGEVPFEAVCGVTNSTKIKFSFDEVKRSVGRVSITLKLGRLQTDEKSFIHYHQPSIVVYTESSVSGIVPILYSENKMKFYDGDFEIKTIVLEWDNALTYLFKGSDSVWIDFRVTPTAEELLEYNDKSSIGDFYKGDRLNMVAITNVMLYEDVLKSAIEKVITWERKYYVSHGGEGVYPPQGKEGENVLTTPPGNRSTCWQVDSADGVNGVPNSSGEMVFMNKVRGRFVFETYEDETLLTGSLAEMENFQRKLYNKAADKGLKEPQTTMQGILPPGLSKLLQDNGVSFTGANTLSLENTLVNRLAEINQFETMRAGGNSYLPVQMYDPSQCGSDDYYVNTYTNMDDFTFDHLQAGAFEQYYWGGIWIIERREYNADLVDFIFPKKYGRNTSSRIYKQEETSSLIYPRIDPNLRWVSGGTGGYTPQNVRVPFPTNIWMGGLFWI